MSEGHPPRISKGLCTITTNKSESGIWLLGGYRAKSGEYLLLERVEPYNLTGLHPVFLTEFSRDAVSYRDPEAGTTTYSKLYVLPDLSPAEVELLKGAGPKPTSLSVLSPHRVLKKHLGRSFERMRAEDVLAMVEGKAFALVSRRRQG